MNDYCESCFEYRVVKWYLIDDNMETTLCAKCAKELRQSGEMKVEVIK